MLQRFGEAAPYLSAAAFLLLTWMMTVGYHVSEVATEVTRGEAIAYFAVKK